MRRAASPKVAAQRLVEAVDRASLDGRVVVLDGALRFSERSWLEVLGILCDLAALQGLTPAEAWEACHYEPRKVQDGGEVKYSVKDVGWQAQAVAVMLRGNPDGYGVVLL